MLFTTRMGKLVKKIVMAMTLILQEDRLTVEKNAQQKAAGLFGL